MCKKLQEIEGLKPIPSLTRPKMHRYRHVQKLKEISNLKANPTVQAQNMHNMQAKWMCTKTARN